MLFLFKYKNNQNKNKNSRYSENGQRIYYNVYCKPMLEIRQQKFTFVKMYIHKNFVYFLFFLL